MAINLGTLDSEYSVMTLNATSFQGVFRNEVNRNGQVL